MVQSIMMRVMAAKAVRMSFRSSDKPEILKHRYATIVVYAI
jgi:hypothetical protein